MRSANGDFSAPLGWRTAGRLEVGPGAARLQLRADASSHDLFRAHFVGRTPEVGAKAGTVTITYPRFSAFDWQKHVGTIALNGSISWDIELRGGVSHLTAELATLRLRSLEVRGGANNIAVSLPRPSGTVRIAFNGDVSRLALYRPPGVAVRIRVTGGVSGLAFDAQRLGVVRGEMVLESPEYATAGDRYDITVSGGATQLAIRGGLGWPRVGAADVPPPRRGT